MVVLIAFLAFYHCCNQALINVLRQHLSCIAVSCTAVLFAWYFTTDKVSDVLLVLHFKLDSYNVASKT